MNPPDDYLSGDRPEGWGWSDCDDDRQEGTAMTATVEAALAVAINGKLYGALPIPAGEDGTAAYRLCRGEDVYDVVRGHDGRITCTCPHYTYRIEGLSADRCKHGRALEQIGLLPR